MLRTRGGASQHPSIPASQHPSISASLSFPLLLPRLPLPQVAVPILLVLAALWVRQLSAAYPQQPALVLDR